MRPPTNAAHPVGTQHPAASREAKIVVMIIAHLSDLHVRPHGAPLAFGRIDTTALARGAIERVTSLHPRPDVVVISGDLTDCGRMEEYVLLRDLLGALRMPVHLVLGNHDRREPFREVFSGWPGLDTTGAFVQFIADEASLRIIGVDTLVSGEGYGALCADRLAWLSARLAERPQTPTALVMHHAPFRVGSQFLDNVRLREGADALKRLVAANPQVERILCGHHHRSIDCLWGGTLASVAPAVVNAVHLDLGAGTSVRAVAEPPAFKLHVGVPGEGLVSHTVYVDAFGGPFEARPDPTYPAMSSFMRETAATA